MGDFFPAVHLTTYFEKIIRITYFGIKKNCKFILSMQQNFVLHNFGSAVSNSVSAEIKHAALK